MFAEADDEALRSSGGPSGLVHFKGTSFLFALAFVRSVGSTGALPGSLVAGAGSTDSRATGGALGFSHAASASRRATIDLRGRAILSGMTESSFDLTPLSSERVQALAAALSPEERRVLLDHGTEHPFCGGLLDNKKAGTYACRLCGLPLFVSSTKFDSGTGWPSFAAPYDRSHLHYIEDRAHGMLRTEIRCARCDGHLGHVFPDGPKPRGERYCLNSASLEFLDEGVAPTLRT